MKRKTIGDNPLDCLIPSIEQVEEKKPLLGKSIAKIECTGKERITIQLPKETIERVKNAVYWTPGMTLSAFADQALLKAVDRLEKDQVFPQRKHELKTGRPLK
jgi:hypothetical protein